MPYNAKISFRYTHFRPSLGSFLGYTLKYQNEIGHICSAYPMLSKIIFHNLEALIFMEQTQIW